MQILKKILHICCVLLFGCLVCLALGVLYVLIFSAIYKINLLSPVTYAKISKFWNDGGVLSADDVIMLAILWSYIPLCLLIFYLFSKFSFLKLLTVPFEWWQNRTLRNYKEVSINIKNLKVEDKKTIEDVVKERLERERGKTKKPNRDELRKNIIEKITKQQ